MKFNGIDCMVSIAILMFIATILFFIGTAYGNTIFNLVGTIIGMVGVLIAFIILISAWLKYRQEFE